MMERIERAAGGLVVRGTKQSRELLLIDDAYGHVTFPKGHLELGETWEAAAIREIQEETGIETRILGPLGRVEYPIYRDGKSVRKQVRFFLLEAVEATTQPTHQAEEVKAAYFLPFDEAKQKHHQLGYRNWDFVFDKAASLLEWYDGDFERVWRQLNANEDTEYIDGVFQKASPVVEHLLLACREELAQCFPELMLPPHEDVESVVLPSAGMPDSDAIRLAVEHTLLSPTASVVEIDNLCLEAKQYGFPLVCVHAGHVRRAAAMLEGSDTAVCTVVAFPHGAESVAEICLGVQSRMAEGAREIDMVIPVGAMIEDDIWTVYRHVSSVIQTAKSLWPSPAVKVILETSALTFDQVMKAALVSVAAGADFIKTSTGFHKGGATLADVHVMARIAGAQAIVKASGGIRTTSAAKQMLRYGARRLGTSSGVALIR